MKFRNIDRSTFDHSKFYTAPKMNILQFEKLLNILSTQIISKKWKIHKSLGNKTIDQLIFRYFNIRNFEISKYRSFYISSFQILTPTHFSQKFSPCIKRNTMGTTELYWYYVKRLVSIACNEFCITAYVYAKYRRTL